jgi:type IV secretory pathway component VirB8
MRLSTSYKNLKTIVVNIDEYRLIDDTTGRCIIRTELKDKFDYRVVKDALLDMRFEFVTPDLGFYQQFIIRTKC